MRKFQSVKCHSLGTNFRDIVDENGKIFAVMVPFPIAERFVADPDLYGGELFDVAVLRGRWISQTDQWLMQFEQKESIQ